MALQAAVAAYASILAWFLPNQLRPTVKKKMDTLLSTMNSDVREKSLQIAMIACDFCASLAGVLVLLISLAVELWRRSETLPIFVIFLLIVPMVAIFLRIRWLDQSEERYNHRLGRVLRWSVLVLSVVLVGVTYLGQVEQVAVPSHSRAPVAELPRPTNH